MRELGFASNDSLSGTQSQIDMPLQHICTPLRIETFGSLKFCMPFKTNRLLFVKTSVVLSELHLILLLHALPRPAPHFNLRTPKDGCTLKAVYWSASKFLCPDACKLCLLLCVLEHRLFEFFLASNPAKDSTLLPTVLSKRTLFFMYQVLSSKQCARFTSDC